MGGPEEKEQLTISKMESFMNEEITGIGIKWKNDREREIDHSSTQISEALKMDKSI